MGKSKKSKRPCQGSSPDSSSRKKRKELKNTDDLESLMGDIVRENPPVDEALVNRIIGTPVIKIDQYWTQADEKKVLAKWDGCERKAASDAIRDKAATNYIEPLLELWRVCLRIFKQSPPIMLSPINGLQFIPQRVSPGSYSRHLFTPDVCRSTAALIVHPIWQQDYRRLIDALSYAVICRLDACRKFAPKDDDCPVLRMLNQQIELEDGPVLREPLHQMHSNARKAIKRQRKGEKPSALSNLLYALGKSIETVDSTKITQGEAESLEQDILPFNKQDLKALKDAINTMKHAQHKVDDSYKAFKELVDLSAALPSRQQLGQWDVRAVKHLFRCYENKARFGSATPVYDVESDDAEEESDREARSPICAFEALDSNPAGRSGDLAIESPQDQGQHLSDEHAETDFDEEEGFNPDFDGEDISPSIPLPTGNVYSHTPRQRSPAGFPPGDFTPRPSINRHPTLGDVEALRSVLDKRDDAQMRQDVDGLMAREPSMGEAEIRQLIRDENASLQSRLGEYAEENRILRTRIEEHAEENHGLQARLEAYEEDSQRFQQQLDHEKREWQKLRETEDQRYRLLGVEVQSLQQQLDQEKRKGQKTRDTQDQRYRLLEAKVKSLNEKLDAQSGLPVVPQQTEEPRQREEPQHVSTIHVATSAGPQTPGPQTSVSIPAGFKFPNIPVKEPKIPVYIVMHGRLLARNGEREFEKGFEETWVSRKA